MSSRVRVKICGLTNEEDARVAIECGADALGFNLWPGSKRCIVLDHESTWIRKLPPFVARVAVLVNAPLSEACRIAADPAIDLLQFHGDEDEGYCANFAEKSGRPFIKAVRVRDGSSLEKLASFSTPHVLLDADAGSAYGGTGIRLDPTLAAEAVQRFPNLRIVLAGGLNPGNIAAAIQAVRPYAVDVASGVEVEPRRKDHGKIAAFLAAI